MIKFFRRIRQRLVSENKFSRYLLYAIGEIALVMIGILLALQVNNWNEFQKLKIQELNLIKQLLEDAKADSVFFESRITFQKSRDTIFNNFLKLHKQIAVDSISKLAVTDDPFFFRLAYQSNLINNNPKAYDLISNNNIKNKLRTYNSKYDYVVHSIELSNRIGEEYGNPIKIKYHEEVKNLPNEPSFGDYSLILQSKEIIATMALFKEYGINYLIQIQKFLIVNQELIILLEKYIKENQ